MPANHASLGVAADERKARLAKLKTLKRKQPGDDVAPEPTGSPSPPDELHVAKLHLSGRNYDSEVKGPRLGFEAPPTLAIENTLELQAEQVEAETRRKAEDEARDDRGVDLFNLQPRKPNWDLKRDLDSKLVVLHARTEISIARIVKARIKDAQMAARTKLGTGVNASEGGEEMGMEGFALVEGVKLREREEEEEERRGRENEDIQ